MQINSNVEICGFNEGKWIRLEGKVVRDERIEAKQSMLDNNPVLKSMYKAEDDNTEVLYFDNSQATIYSFTEEPKIIKFQIK